MKKGANFFIKRRKITFCVGLLGDLADSSIVARHGDTVVHAVVTTQHLQTFSDFSTVPLTIDYRDRSYAHGRIPTTPNRREKTNTDEEVLAARVIDRSVRPLFPKGSITESLQVVVTCHALDSYHDPVALGINAVSAALLLSSIPWKGPIGCCRIGYIDDKLVVNPNISSFYRHVSTSTSSMERELSSMQIYSSLNLLYAGNSSGRVLMVEAEGDEVDESIINEAFNLAQESIKGVINSQIYLKNEVGNMTGNGERRKMKNVLAIDPKINDFLFHIDAMGEAMNIYSSSSYSKSERGQREGRLRSELYYQLLKEFSGEKYSDAMVSMALDNLLFSSFRKVLLDNNGSERNDGRTKDEVRLLDSFGDFLPSVHGSSIFKRGETHILCAVTLSSMTEARMNPHTISGGTKTADHFILHYDFPPYCTGDVGNIISLNRRAIGHGNLAERALKSIIPCTDSFPYTIKVSCECTSSNGSSAMASVVAATLALIDAGVPISALIAGISIGLITSEEKNDEEYVLLTDITGTEDHYGDMDLKVAGSDKGITAIQLDTKLDKGISLVIMSEAMQKARAGRQVILNHLKKQISSQKSCKSYVASSSIYTPHKSLQLVPLICINDLYNEKYHTWMGGSGFGGSYGSKLGVKRRSPKSIVIHFNPEKKRHLLGPGGEMIKFIKKEFDCNIDLDDDGKIYVFGTDNTLVKDAISLVQDLVGGVKEGSVYNAEIIEIKDFGALVRLSRAQEAILHISEINDNEKVSRRFIEDVLCVGQNIDVKVVHVDSSTGLVKVSIKGLSSYQNVIDENVLIDIEEINKGN